MKLRNRLFMTLGILGLVMGCTDGRFKGGGSSAQAPLEKPVETEKTADATPTVNAEFGVDGVFRIGDGTAGAQSACVGELKSFDLKGTIYYFQFEVLNDDTQVELSIGKICGVDRADTNVVSVIRSDSGTEQLPEKVLPTDASQLAQPVWTPFPAFKLQKGTYSVVVTSKNVLGKPKAPGPATTPSGVDDHDDFLIGNIILKGDKPIQSVKVYAE
ncbi:hypothetical protein [Oligoflexus tunisiensis]|uniref:hypothetical protein n=1 Tax=Oligoflexus tunisiensis TaxID=708132 RepID=UPI00114C8E8B|nr:hypothetical protein [Oligoflexus tunisiensis]